MDEPIQFNAPLDQIPLAEFKLRARGILERLTRIDSFLDTLEVSGQKPSVQRAGLSMSAARAGKQLRELLDDGLTTIRRDLPMVLTMTNEERLLLVPLTDEERRYVKKVLQAGLRLQGRRFLKVVESLDSWMHDRRVIRGMLDRIEKMELLDSIRASYLQVTGRIQELLPQIDELQLHLTALESAVAIAEAKAKGSLN